MAKTQAQDWIKKNLEFVKENAKKHRITLTNPSIISASFFCALHSSWAENAFVVSELACENSDSRLLQTQKQKTPMLTKQTVLWSRCKKEIPWIFKHAKTLCVLGSEGIYSFISVEAYYYHVTLSSLATFPFCIWLF